MHGCSSESLYHVWLSFLHHIYHMCNPSDPHSFLAFALLDIRTFSNFNVNKIRACCKVHFEMREFGINYPNSKQNIINEREYPYYIHSNLRVNYYFMNKSVSILSLNKYILQIIDID